MRVFFLLPDAQVLARSQFSMHAEKVSLDAAIAKALLRTHLSDQIEIIVEAMQDYPAARSCQREQLDDIRPVCVARAGQSREPV